MASSIQQSDSIPQISLEIKASIRTQELLLTLPYDLEFTIRRSVYDSGGPFIFRWSPFKSAFASANLFLRQVSDEGPQRVIVDPLPQGQPDEDTITVNGLHYQNVHELVPGGEIMMRASLAGNYQQRLKPGERYELFWPGGEVRMWDWGSVSDHLGKTLATRRANGGERGLPQLILFASNIIAFTAVQEKESWPERPETSTAHEFHMANVAERRWRADQYRLNHPQSSPSSAQATERSSSAPNLTMQIECPPEWRSETVVKLKLTVTYEGNEGNESGSNAKPITFHATSFMFGDGDREGLQLYQFVNGEWVRIEQKEAIGYHAFVDDPPISVNVGGEGPYSNQFVSLRPRESWTYERHVQNVVESRWTSLPDSAKAGDRFKYLVTGALVDWWDWGTKGEHRDTVVKLLLADLSVAEPADNGGRPKMVIPASNEAVFTYAG